MNVLQALSKLSKLDRQHVAQIIAGFEKSIDSNGEKGVDIPDGVLTCPKCSKNKCLMTEYQSARIDEVSLVICICADCRSVWFN